MSTKEVEGREYSKTRERLFDVAGGLSMVSFLVWMRVEPMMLPVAYVAFEYFRSLRDEERSLDVSRGVAGEEDL